MTKKLYFRMKAFMLSFACLFGFQSQAQITENFDNITLLAGSGWVMQNNSAPIGSTNWFQGNATAFPSFNGATDSYIGANFNNTAGTGTISNWLITPNVTLKNGDVFTFYTRTTVDNMWADNLQVRMSTAGASTNVGTAATSVGDFTTVLLEINPSLLLSTYPMSWTQYSITITGLTAPTSGRLAFRYYVPNGGPSGTNSDYIGIDAFSYTPYVCPTLSVTPGTLPNGTAGVAYTQTLSQTGALGTPSYAVTSGSLPPGVTLGTGGNFSGSPTATGVYNFTVTVTDQSGCTGSTAYTLTIDCPTGGASLAPFPTLCAGDAPIVLTQGSPSGGTYSGTGVTGSSFDPSAGTQVITYSLTDVYGCPQSANGTITVNPLPTVTLSPLADACSNDASITLSGGTPTGGTYSGTGVSGGIFNPAAGTQNITYSYTDGNGCTDTDMQTIIVHTAPTVSLSAFSDACEGEAAFPLSGGSPAGGTYSGTGVTAGSFDPSSIGTFNITYDYTDGNGCSGSASQDITVVSCLSVSEVSGLNDFNCYPNPTDGQVTVQFFEPATSDITVHVINAEGKRINTQTWHNFNGSFNEEFDLSDYEKGVYIIEVISTSGSAKQRIVLQ